MADAGNSKPIHDSDDRGHSEFPGTTRSGMASGINDQGAGIPGVNPDDGLAASATADPRSDKYEKWECPRSPQAFRHDRFCLDQTRTLRQTIKVRYRDSGREIPDRQLLST